MRFLSCISVDWATLTPSPPSLHTSTLTHPTATLFDTQRSVRKTGWLNLSTAEYTFPDCSASITINNSLGMISDFVNSSGHSFGVLQDTEDEGPVQDELGYMYPDVFGVSMATMEVWAEFEGVGFRYVSSCILASLETVQQV